MKRKRREKYKGMMMEQLFQHIQDEVRTLSAEELERVREDSERNALLVEAIKQSMERQR